MLFLSSELISSRLRTRNVAQLTSIGCYFSIVTCCNCRTSFHSADKKFLFIPIMKPTTINGGGRRSRFTTNIPSSVVSRRIRLYFAFYVLFSVQSFVIRLLNLSRYVTENMSLSRFSYICYFLFACVHSILTMKVIYFYSTRILELIRGDLKRKWVERLAIMFVLLPALIWVLMKIVHSCLIGNVLDVLYYVGYVHQLIVVLMIVGTHLESLAVLQHHAESSVARLLTIQCSFDNIVTEKWHIRDRINEVNGIFSAYIFIFYMLISVESVVTVEIFVADHEPLLYSISSIGRLGPFVIAYFMAHRS